METSPLGGLQRRPLLPLVTAAVAAIVVERADLPGGAAPALLLAAGAGLANWKAREATLGRLLLAAGLVYAVAYARSAFLRAERRRAAQTLAESDALTVRARIEQAPLIWDSTAGQRRRRRPVMLRILPPHQAAGARVLAYAHARAFAPRPEPGSLYTLHLRLHRQRPLPFPGAFDWDAYLERRGACASATVLKTADRTPAPAWSLTFHLHRLRRLGVLRTRQAIPDARGDFLAAVLFGHRKGVSPDLREAFQHTGTAHLLAISGLHIGLVSALAWCFLRRLRFPPRPAAVGSMVACLLYLGVSGMRPSAVRASIMALMYLGGILLTRRSDVLNALACAALFILLHHPPTVADAGFILSFTAVLFLCRLSHEFHRWGWSAPPPTPGKDGPEPAPAAAWRSRFHDLFKLSLAAWIGLWPLCAYYFRLLCFGSLALNPIVIPGLSLILAGGAALQVTAYLPVPLDTLGQSLCAAPTDLLFWLVDCVDRVEWLRLRVNPPAPWAIATYYAVCTLFFLRRALRLTGRHLLLPMLFSVVALVVTMHYGPRPNETSLTVLGKTGKRCLIHESSRGEAILIGHLRDNARLLADYLRNRRVKAVTGLLLLGDPSPAAATELDGLVNQLGPAAPPVITALPHALPPAERVRIRSRQSGIEPPCRVTAAYAPSGELAGWLVEAGPQRVLFAETPRVYGLMRMLPQIPGAQEVDLAWLQVPGTRWPRGLWRWHNGLHLGRWRGRPAVHLKARTILVDSFAEPVLPAGVHNAQDFGAVRLDTDGLRCRRQHIFDGHRWWAWKRAPPALGD